MMMIRTVVMNDDCHHHAIITHRGLKSCLASKNPLPHSPRQKGSNLFVILMIMTMLIRVRDNYHNDDDDDFIRNKLDQVLTDSIVFNILEAIDIFQCHVFTFFKKFFFYSKGFKSRGPFRC